MTIRSLQTQLSALTPDEKYQTIQFLATALNHSHFGIYSIDRVWHG
jgi:hypothetical protein